MFNDNTICAISTPPGTGGIATVRISGSEALLITSKVCQLMNKKQWELLQPNTVHFAHALENEEIIDEVLCTILRAPHSFTGEDTVEISCHGSSYIQQKILQLLIQHGASLAKPGEFTQRAFLNGKMDLSQAEAVADLITSSSEAEHRLAISQMRGGFSQELKNLREQLLQFISLIELELDFSEEDVEFADRSQLVQLAEHIATTLSKLCDSFQTGNAIKNGIPVAIVGETNAGKSTLLNHLLQEDRAIVSDIHGTTRDAIEDTMIIQGITFRFIDTAGIRQTDDTIENMGIQRTFDKLHLAHIVLLVVDCQKEIEHIHTLIENMLERCQNKKLIVLFNKTDRLSTSQIQELRTIEFHKDLDAALFISAKHGENIQELTELLTEFSETNNNSGHDIIVSNLRHYEALSLAHEDILRAIEGLKTQVSGDFLAMDIRQCIQHLGEITGEISPDEILGNIFKNFCIGK